MKVACLISGGKDSLYACYIAKQWGWSIEYVISVRPTKLSWMYHSENVHLMPLIAKSMNIPLLIRVSNAEKEEELNDLKELIKKAEVEGIISGAVASEYQRTRIEKICHDIGVKSFTPLWHKNQAKLLEEMLSAGFIIMIDAVAAMGLGDEFLGKIIDENMVKKFKEMEIKYGINPGGEGGEYETLVIDCPLYTKKLKVMEGSKKWQGNRGIYEVKTVELVEK